jgi:hypothetical protein
MDTPNRQPQLAASKSMVALVFGSGRSILFSRSLDQGRTFSTPVRIAEAPVLPLSRHRGPRVAFSGKTIVVTAIAGTEVATGPHAHGLPSDGNLLVWRSTDQGRTWSKPAMINDAPASAREGLHALAADADGSVAAVWLDLRAKGTRLYGAISRDAGATWSPNLKIYESPDGTICQCCHPSVLAHGRGEFSIMFRNVLEGCRDMYVLRMRGDRVITAPEKLGDGKWEITACPMDGGGMALSNGRTLTAWRRDQHVFLAVPGEKEALLGEGKDVALAAAEGKVFAVWNKRGEIQSYVSGVISSISSEGAFPSVTTLGDGGALAAWEEKGSIAIRRLD